ncbi:MAG: HPr family phosphocarrier protein [Candidatus Ruminococcus intestinipullorum]|nr:HPr family phosphocarrier protein [Candidatus Ruminococcus intestinipullorum]
MLTSEDNVLCIKFDNIEDVQEFSRIANEFTGDVDLYQGRVIIDGKSLLGIYSMDIEKEIKIKIYNGSLEEFSLKIKRFLV